MPMRKPFIHPDIPMPRAMITLLSVLEELQYSPLKFFWVGIDKKGEHAKRRHQYRFGNYMAAVINYRPGVEHRLGIDFMGANDRLGGGNRRRSNYCSYRGIEYLVLKRSDSRAEMMTKIRATVTQLRSATEYIPYEQKQNANDPDEHTQSTD